MLIKTANKSISKMLLCKNSVYQLVNCNDVKEIMKICLELICAVMDCNFAEIYIEVDNILYRITKEGYKYIEFDKDYDKISEYLKIEKIIKKNGSEIFSMHVPINYKDLKGYLKLEDNRTALEKKFIDFRLEGDELLMELCRKIGQATYSFPDTEVDSLKSLAECIKMLAFQYKPYALNCVVNIAAKNLVDGERAVFFSYKDKKLIVEKQGNDLEIPKNYVETEFKGIVFDVFTNRKPEIVQNAYSDERFTPIFDKLAGYKTENLICIPLITDFEKFGAIEVLNKRSGRFKLKDLRLLEKFGEVVCMVLEIMNTMHITLEERFRLLAISNSMENYILVFNENRNLVYMNKPIDKIFGVYQEQIMNLTYFA